jgi:dihydroorotate dehydrogenase electron transfer subunit
LRQEIAAVTANAELMPQIHLMWLESPYIASQTQPGQFVMVCCGEDTLLRRPFSVHQADGNRLALFFNVVGRGTHWLSQRQAGDKLDLLGPLGNGFTIYPASQNLLLVAGGMGIAPLYLLAQDALKKKHSLTLLYGTADKKRLSIPPQIKVVSATEDGTIGQRGMITEILPDYISQADQLFACGPLQMYQSMAQMPQLKNRPVQVSLEVRMGCGLGVCYGCTVKTKSGLKQVCKDGPVFDLNDILWEELS